MKKIQKICLSMIMVLLLSISAPGIGILSTTEIAMAATNSSTPTASVDKVSLYVGYKTYQVKLKNLAKTATVTYKSSNTKIAKVSNKGVITAVAKGNTTISVTMKQNKKTYTSKIKVTVDSPVIKITKKTDNLIVGGTYTFAATATGTDSKVAWQVSDTSLASIDGVTGEFKALKKGTVTVTASAGKLKITSKVTINTPRFTTEAKELTLYEEKLIYIDVPKMDKDETLDVASGNSDIVKCTWGDWDGDRLALLIDTYAVGTTTVTITSSKYSDKLIINVNVIKRPEVRDSAIKELNAKEVYSKCAPSTVELQVTKYDGDYIGSGFFLYSGVIVTNFHVVDGAYDIKVINYKGKSYDVQKVLAYDEELDLAVLTIDAVTDHLTLYSDDIMVGEDVYALGSPKGLSGSLSKGIVSSASREYDGVEYLQITAPISGGNSGGPLINSYGEVIGVNTFVLLESQNLNFAVEIYQINKLSFKSPIAAADFYAANKKADEPIKVTEDTAKTGHITTAQDVANNTLVSGALGGANRGDIYHLKLDGYQYVGIDLTVVGTDASNVFVGVYTAEKLIDYSYVYKKEDGSKANYVIVPLPAGDYYIIVGSLEDYTPSISYEFLVRCAEY